MAKLRWHRIKNELCPNSLKLGKVVDLVTLNKFHNWSKVIGLIPCSAEIDEGSIFKPEIN